MKLVRGLNWPNHVPFHDEKDRKRGSFKRNGNPITVTWANFRIFEEVRKLGGDSSLVISAEFQTTQTGKVSETWNSSSHPGAVVMFEAKGQKFVIPCDTYTELPQNLAAIAAHLEAVRAIERYGVASTAQMLSVHALPSFDWRSVLGATSLAEAEENYRKLARSAHPDLGGSDQQMARLNRAIEEARRECKSQSS